MKRQYFSSYLQPIVLYIVIIGCFFALLSIKEAYAQDDYYGGGYYDDGGWHDLYAGDYNDAYDGIDRGYDPAIYGSYDDYQLDMNIDSGWDATIGDYTSVDIGNVELPKLEVDIGSIEGVYRTKPSDWIQGPDHEWSYRPNISDSISRYGTESWQTDYSLPSHRDEIATLADDWLNQLPIVTYEQPSLAQGQPLDFNQIAILAENWLKEGADDIVGFADDSPLNNFRIYQADTGLSQAKVIIVGDGTHGKFTKEISDLLGKLVKDGDMVLREGQQKGKDLTEAFRGCDSTYIMPEMYGAKGKNIEVRGADDIDSRDAAVEAARRHIEIYERMAQGDHSPPLVQEAGGLLNIIREANEQRDEAFVSTISEEVAKGRRVILICGEAHITGSTITSGKMLDALKKEGISYAALVPTEDRTSIEYTKEYLGLPKQETSDNYILNVKLPNGRTKDLGYGWFRKKDGSELTHQDMANIESGITELSFFCDSLNDVEHFEKQGLVNGEKYIILDVSPQFKIKDQGKNQGHLPIINLP